MFRLIANTVSVESNQPRDWQTRTASSARPTELAFLVFEITVEYDWLEYLAGLYVEYTESGYIVAGTMEKMLAAAKHYDTPDHPHEVRRFYAYVKQKCRDFGYTDVC